MNRLDRIIPDKRIYFKKVAGDFDYKVLMRDEDVEISENVANKYEELNNSKSYLIRSAKRDHGYNEGFYVNTYIRNELLKECSDIELLTDMLVKYLYDRKTERRKSILWDSFGDVLIERVRENLKGTKVCEICGDRFSTNSSLAKYCPNCAQEKQKEWQKESMKRYRTQ